MFGSKGARILGLKVSGFGPRVGLIFQDLACKGLG